MHVWKERKLMNYINFGIFLLMAVFLNSNYSNTQSIFEKKLCIHRQELQGFLDQDLSIYLVDKKELRLPHCVNGIVEIPADIRLYDIGSVIALGYAFQFASLVTGEQKNSLIKYLTFELIAKNYSLRYFLTFKEHEKEKHLNHLLESAFLEYELIRNYEKLMKQQNSNEEIVNLLKDYLMKKYEAREDIVTSLNQACKNVVKALPLACPTHVLMTEGGDGRLHVNWETGTNKYHISTIPRGDLIVRSSCTCSPPTIAGFREAEDLRIKLLKVAIDNKLDNTFDQHMSEIRHRAKTAFVDEKLRDGVSVICTPSGSDAEMMFTLLGLARYDDWESKVLNSPNSLVLNIVTAAGEVGSGSARAAGMKHFNASVPNGSCVEIGTNIEGVVDKVVTVMQLQPRNSETGKPINLDEYERNLEKLVSEAIEERNQVVVLHMVHASKTGLAYPRFSFLNKVKKLYGEKIVAVVDAKHCETLQIHKA